MYDNNAFIVHSMRGQKMLAKPTETALSTELAEAVDRARDFAKASKADATRKAYASDLRDFAAYCQRTTGTATAGLAPRANRSSLSMAYAPPWRFVVTSRNGNFCTLTSRAEGSGRRRGRNWPWATRLSPCHR